jgi:hypothetical protein
MGEALVDLIQDPLLLDKITARWERIRIEHPSTRGPSSIEEGNKPSAKDESIN